MSKSGEPPVSIQAFLPKRENSEEEENPLGASGTGVSRKLLAILSSIGRILAPCFLIRNQRARAFL